MTVLAEAKFLRSVLYVRTFGEQFPLALPELVSYLAQAHAVYYNPQELQEVFATFPQIFSIDPDRLTVTLTNQGMEGWP